MTSRERLLAALSCQVPDHVPLSFLGVAPLEIGLNDKFGRVERWLSFGFDPRVELPGPVEVKPGVVIREWKEHPPGERYPILVKEYDTSKGMLRTEMRQTADWETGDSISLFSDQNVGRARKHLIESPQDLDKLEALLCLPQDVDLSEMGERAAALRRFAKEKQLLLQGWGGNGGDVMTWLSGVERIAIAVIEEPDFIRRYLEIVQRWDMAWAEVILDWGAELLYRRGWYEPPPIYSPKHFLQFIAPMLKAQATLAHQAGAKIVHLASSGSDDVAQIFVDIGVDSLFGVDPVQAGSNLPWLKENFGGRICFWGGVNAPLTVEMGTPQEVRAATEFAIKTLAPGGGFILSAVDSIRNPNCRENVEAMVEAWRELASYPIAM